jgi:hypothetical protein
VNAPVPSISARGNLPRELDPVFERALAKDPAQRYETCAEFVAALRAAFAEAAGSTSELPAVVPPPTAPTRHVERHQSRNAWPLLTALLVLGALGGGLLAYFLTRDDGSNTAPTTVITQVQTVTTQGETKTVERPVTVTSAPTTTAAAPPPRPSSSASASSLAAAGFNKMRQGDYNGALPLLEQAQQKLQGAGSLSEAYNAYNLAFTRFQLGSCDGVLELLDRSESIQGNRGEIDRLRQDAEDRCG